MSRIVFSCFCFRDLELILGCCDFILKWVPRNETIRAKNGRDILIQNLNNDILLLLMNELLRLECIQCCCCSCDCCRHHRRRCCYWCYYRCCCCIVAVVVVIAVVFSDNGSGLKLNRFSGDRQVACFCKLLVPRNFVC